MPTHDEGMTLAIALAVTAGGMLGFGAHCQVKHVSLAAKQLPGVQRLRFPH